MKKRILAMLLAGLLTASFASCVSSGSREDPSGTESRQETPTTAATEEPPTPSVSWTEVDQTVYTTDSVKLRESASSAAKVLETLPAATELHRVKTSTAWSEVEYNGKTGYVSNAYVTTVDILGKNFTPVDGGSKIMYANAACNVRLYPSTDDFSKKVGSYQMNDEVKVLATNEKWAKIEYKTSSGTATYFISLSCLSSTKVTDPNDPTQYEGLFTDCEKKTLYTTGTVALRKVPSTATGVTVLDYLKQGVKVTALKTGTANEINWTYVEAEVPPQKEGDPVQYIKGYVSSRYLSSSSTTKVTIDELLAAYPGAFTKVNKTMYVLASVDALNARTSPEFINEDKTTGTKSNVGAILTPKEKLTVVAVGNYNDNNWCVIEYKTGDFYFVGSSQLTSSADGKVVLVLDDIKVKYPEFTVLETAESATASGTVNCYETPETADKPAKALSKGDTVKIVAKQTGADRNVWCIIQLEEGGTLYFAAMSLFE